MYPCPRCRASAFDGARCQQCGYVDPRTGGVRIVTGQGAPAPAPAEPAPVALDPSALLEVEEDEGPSLPGFESTAHATSAGGRAAPRTADLPPDDEEDDFVYQTCPRCRSPQPDPPETFCAHCGYRVKRKLRTKAARTDRVRTCRECGTPNEPGGDLCINCGFVLPTD